MGPKLVLCLWVKCKWLVQGVPRSGSGLEGVIISPVLFPVPGPLGLIGFDAADVVGCALLKRGHQVIGLFLRQRERQE